MKKLIDIPQKIKSKLIDEAARQQMILNEPVYISDLIRFYIEQGLKSKPKINK